MSATKEDIEEILSKTKDGNIVLEYINYLEDLLNNSDDDYEDTEDSEWEEIKTDYKSDLTVEK